MIQNKPGSRLVLEQTLAFITGGYHTSNPGHLPDVSIGSPVSDYAGIMGNAKFCLCPKGANWNHVGQIGRIPFWS